MVLSRLRILGATDEPEPTAQHPLDDGSPMTFPALLDRARRDWGDKIAFQQKERREWVRYSHHDIYKRSYEFAAGFVGLGVHPGDRVGLVLENSIEWICAYYGIVLAGAIAVPMYYELKSSELEAMVAHTDARVLVASSRVLPKLDAIMPRLSSLIVVGENAASTIPNELARARAPQRIALDDLPSCATEDAWRDLRSRPILPDDVASIVFTSGTTGGMKGVMLSHRNFLANCRSIRQAIPFGERDRLIVVLPMHHAFPFTLTAVVAPAVGGEVTFENDLRRIRDRMAEVKPTLFSRRPGPLRADVPQRRPAIEARGPPRDVRDADCASAMRRSSAPASTSGASSSASCTSGSAAACAS